MQICKRNGKEETIGLGIKRFWITITKNLMRWNFTVHRWFANKSCPLCRLVMLPCKALPWTYGVASTGHSDCKPDYTLGEDLAWMQTRQHRKGASQIWKMKKACREQIRDTCSALMQMAMVRAVKAIPLNHQTVDILQKRLIKGFIWVGNDADRRIDSRQHMITMG